MQKVRGRDTHTHLFSEKQFGMSAWHGLQPDFVTVDAVEDTLVLKQPEVLKFEHILILLVKQRK